MAEILNILQWVIPSGGIGAAIAWLVHRKVLNARDAKTIHDTYKKMYEDVSEHLTKINEKYEKLQDEINRLRETNDELERQVKALKRAMQTIRRCKYYDQCPVRDELRDGKKIDSASGDDGQHPPAANVDAGADKPDRASETGHGAAGSDGFATADTPAERGAEQRGEGDKGDDKKDV